MPFRDPLRQTLLGGNHLSRILAGSCLLVTLVFAAFACMDKPVAFQGYSLIAAMTSKETYLIDMDGRVVNSWKSEYTPGISAFLLENGHLLRTANTGQGGFAAGGGGKIEEFTWDGELVWEYTFEEERKYPHHDICRLPNGNVLMIAWDKKTGKETIAMGRSPELTREDAGFMSDCILEVKQTGPKSGEIVWQWCACDHLIQDFDPDKPNFGNVSAHPELIDINYAEGMMAKMMGDPEELSKLRSLGYVSGGPVIRQKNSQQEGERAGRRRGFPGFPGAPRGPIADWIHTNSVHYNAELDQIMLSVHGFNEVWIIDHSTTTEEAASSKGGRYGRGGDLLYRWGNPRAYRNGTKEDQRLFAQHDAHWIPQGLPGEGHMLVFNNGMGRLDGNYSSVDEIVLPVDASGNYKRKKGSPYGPDRAKWSYSAPDKTCFYSMVVSGAHRLPNGNTYICSGMPGILFEVTLKKKIVWEYKTPSLADDFPFPMPFGGNGSFPSPFGGDGRFSLLPGFLQVMLELDDDQRTRINDLESEVKDQLDELFSEEQSVILLKPRSSFGKPGKFRIPQPGKVIQESVKEELKLTDGQTNFLEMLQEDIDRKIAAILNDEQNARLKQMASFTPPQGFGSSPGFSSPPGFGPPPGSGPSGGAARKAMPSGFSPLGFGSPNSNPFGGFGAGLFRSYRYAPDYPGLKGRDLTPGELLKDLVAKKMKSGS